MRTCVVGVCVLGKSRKITENAMTAEAGKAKGVVCPVFFAIVLMP